jgi:hypothetical protein
MRSGNVHARNRGHCKITNTTLNKPTSIMMEVKKTPRKRSAEVVDLRPVLSAKRRLNRSDSSYYGSQESSSSRATRVHFSTDQNSKQTAATDIYQGLSEEECCDLRSQIWYTVRRVHDDRVCSPCIAIL